MTTPARSAASLTDYQPERTVVKESTALDARLSLVSDHLAEAESAVAILVRRLEPVLPMGFAGTTRPENDLPPRTPENSFLAARLSDVADRVRSLVLHVSSVVEAVDL